MALQATDRRLVENTVRSLQALDAGWEEGANDTTTVAGYLPTLMAHLVRRMVRRHSLAMPLRCGSGKDGAGGGGDGIELGTAS